VETSVPIRFEFLGVRAGAWSWASGLIGLNRLLDPSGLTGPLAEMLTMVSARWVRRD
jgi:hypothetical protein